MKTAQRGSALLIVLGFLSFMVVSAVAFSIYMRSERLPSSALRRAVATRHLVKAALARAIGDIDDAVRQEPFPGCMGANGPLMSGSAYGKSWPSGRRRAEWYGRVFMPICWEGPAGYEDRISQMDVDDLYFVPSSRQGETVSTMTLEGMGYVPPPLINEARLIGPKSWSSKWHYFDYDAGRYAYTALNVSDYFDLNSVHIETNRNSGADGRLSLAYLFADSSGKIKTSSVENFEKFVHKNRNTLNKYSFVSMLDYSLALAGNATSYNLSNPFYDYLKSGGRTLFYGNSWGDGYASVSTDEEYLKIARQVFVTDSWCPATNLLDKVNTVDLSDPKWQPFDNVPEQDANLMDLSEDNKFWNKFLKEFPISTAAMLYDYLDADDIPTSLVLPCTEYMPMIAEFDISGQPEVILKTSSSDEKDADGNVISSTTTYLMDLNVPRLEVAVTPVFPFKRGRDRMESTSYSVQAVVRLFFAPASTLNRSSGFGAVDWTKYTSSKKEIEDMSSVVFVSDKKSFSIPSNIDSEDDAEIKNVLITLPAFNQGDLKLLEVTQKKGAAEQVVIPDGAFRFLNADYSTGDIGLADVVPQVTVNLRVTCGSDTVDVVPARVADDQLNNRQKNASVNNINEVCGSKVPLLRFATKFSNRQLTLTKEGLSQIAAGGAQVNLTADDWKNTGDSYVCCDPRFNWAPEDWFLRQGSGNGFQDWLSATSDLLGKDDAHDGDIFMNCSNVGYLQSIAEFMFIPRVSELDGSRDAEWGYLRRGDSVYNGTIHTDVTQLANRDCMWRCYKARQLGGDDDLFGLGVVSGNGGYKVNPYTDNEQIFLAAIANTPVDWWAAGTNTNSRTSSKSTTDVKFSNAIKDTYGPESDTDKWTWDEVRSISSALQTQMRANSTSADSWLNAYDSYWRDRFNNDDENQLFGQQISGSKLCDADRKFLYAFWRECFGCCQQLYLIFVRAESTALGGSGDGRTPGQLGGRAVALVWRDPNQPKNSQDTDYNQPKALSEGDTDTSPRPPHKTRVLFYHQFD